MTHTCILEEMEIKTARTIVMAMTTFPKHQQAHTVPGHEVVQILEFLT